MKTISYIIAVVVLSTALFSACTKAEKPAQNKEVKLVATLSPNTVATRTTMTDNGDGTITTSWEAGDFIWVKYINTSDSEVEAKATVTSVDGSGNATINVTMTDPKDASTITFGFPYNYWNENIELKTNQIGTLENIKTKYAASSGSGTLTVSGGKATLPTGVTMTPSVCIWKLSFTDGSTNITSGITKLNIFVGSDKYVVTPSSLSNIYVAVSGSATPKFVSIAATTASGIFMKEKSGVTLAAGKMYTSNALALSKVYYFSIGLWSTKRVILAPGNLQATYSGSSWTWKIAENQYDYIGNAGGNILITTDLKETTEPYGRLSADGTVDLFGRSTEDTYYGICKSTNKDNYNGTFVDWGTLSGISYKGVTYPSNYWRTFTAVDDIDNANNEWAWIMRKRTTGVTVNGTNNACYAKAEITISESPLTKVKGVILFPDNYDGGTPAGVTWGTINGQTASYETTCTLAGWEALEAAGCVFLPSAGRRSGTSVSDVNNIGFYWVSTKRYNGASNVLVVEPSQIKWNWAQYFSYQYSVRLAHDIN